MPVAAFGEFLLNDVADQKDLAAAKEVGDYEGCQCRNKYHGDAADDAWKAQRQPHIDQRLKEVGSQVMGCIDGIVVDLAEYVVHREYHKGQEVVNHAEYNGETGVLIRDWAGRCRACNRPLITPFFSKSVSMPST